MNAEIDSINPESQSLGSDTAQNVDAIQDELCSGPRVRNASTIAAVMMAMGRWATTTSAMIRMLVPSCSHSAVRPASRPR
jgi:hypothetical protein